MLVYFLPPTTILIFVFVLESFFVGATSFFTIGMIFATSTFSIFFATGFVAFTEVFLATGLDVVFFATDFFVGSAFFVAVFFATGFFAGADFFATGFDVGFATGAKTVCVSS